MLLAKTMMVRTAAKREQDAGGDLIMNKGKTFGTSVALLLAGCSGTTKCDSPDAKAAVLSIISDEVTKQTKSQLGDNISSIGSVNSKIRATLDQVKFSIDDIRTARADPDSTKRFCEGTLKVIFPLNIIAEADEVNADLELPQASAAIEGSGFERSADKFTRSMSFTVQPTDDGQKLFAEIDAFNNVFVAFGDVIS
jgi:hypothetical protein